MSAAKLDGAVLVLEDNMIIALDLEDMLKALGAREVVTAGRVDDALAALSERRFDLALLDVNIDGATCAPVAERLAEQGTTFLFSTGYSQRHELSDAYPDIVTLEKPVTTDMLGKAIARAVL